MRFTEMQFYSLFLYTEIQINVRCIGERTFSIKHFTEQKYGYKTECKCVPKYSMTDLMDKWFQTEAKIQAF